MAKVVWKDESSINEAIANVRKDGSGFDWLTCAYVHDSKDQIELVGTGKGGVEESNLKIPNFSVTKHQ